MLEVGGFSLLFLASSLLFVASDHPGRELFHFIVIVLPLLKLQRTILANVTHGTSFTVVKCDVETVQINCSQVLNRTEMTFVL